MLFPIKCFDKFFSYFFPGTKAESFTIRATRILVGAAVTSALVADIPLVVVGLSEAAAPQEVWPETEVTAHLQLPQPEAAKLADPPDSEVQRARQARLLLQPPSTTQDHPRQVGFQLFFSFLPIVLIIKTVTNKQN